MPVNDAERLFQDLITFRDWVRWASSEFRRAELFFGHGTETDYDEALYIALWAISQPWERVDQLWGVRLTLAEKQALLKAIQRRIVERCPAAYITGEAWFCDLPFIVNENVLVPRSPIAELIQTEFEPWLEQRPETILDLCTGSGCIGIACAVAFPESQVDLIDISPEALEVAHENILKYKLEGRVNTIQSDALSVLTDQRYDLIVSNPPYVSEAEYAELPAEYLSEPKLGLTSGEDGFDFVRDLLLQAEKHLNPQGLLVVEVGYGWQSFDALFQAYPLLWPEFENGGEGVFILTREQLGVANSSTAKASHTH